MKKWIALLLAAMMCLSLCACGSDGAKGDSASANEVELNVENITDYLHVEITYTKTGKTNILKQPEMERTITIYPIKDGRFEHVQLLISDILEWKADSSELGASLAEYEYSSINKYFTLAKIALPADGNYTCTQTFWGVTPLATLPNNHVSTEGWGHISLVEDIDEDDEEKFGSDFVKAGDHIVSGTFKAN